MAASPIGMADPAPPTPMAGGLPLPEHTADEAAEWLTLLMSGEADTPAKRRWQQWREAHPDNERAWQHIEAVTARFKGLPTEVARRSLSTLERPASARRRSVIRSVLGLGAAVGAGAMVSRTPIGRQWVADHRTATGERRAVALDDGTHLLLDGGSAIDVRFDVRQRMLRLIAGEVLITTGHGDGADRPFVVQGLHGSVRALGTRFTVRQSAQRTRVAVFEGAVEIAPVTAMAARQVLLAGEQATFDSHQIGTRTAADEASLLAWTRGQLIADEMRLGDFIADLARHRPGLLRCDPAVADLRFSGVFPLDDTDRILDALPNVLPVQVRLRTRYWVTVEADRQPGTK